MWTAWCYAGYQSRPPADLQAMLLRAVAVASSSDSPAAVSTRTDTANSLPSQPLVIGTSMVICIVISGREAR